MHPPIHFVTARDGVQIAYCTHGTGPPLVYVRGWISHLELLWQEDAFRSFFERLATSRCLVRFDARGNGLSDRRVADLSLDGLVSDLEAVVAALGGGPVALLGSTYGTPIAAAFTARHPDDVTHLVLDGSFGAGQDLGDETDRARILTLVAMLERQPAAGATLSFLTSPELSGSHADRMRRAQRSIRPAVAEALYGLAFDLDVREELRSIRCPTLVLHRRHSNAVPLAAGMRVAGLVPGARFVALDGSAANIWEQDTRATLAALAEFLELPDSVVPGRPVRPPSPPTVVLFTDLEGSTALTSALGDLAAQALLHEHDLLVRSLLDAWGGRVVKHTGDGMMTAFSSVTGALSAARALQVALDERNRDGVAPALGVRIGMNAGEPVEEEGDLFGTVVQLAARLCDSARAGQVVVSNVVRELAAGKGFVFDDLGPTDLKGFPDPVRRWALRPG